MTDLLLGKRVQAHLYIGRIPLDKVPVEEEACAQWLYQLYEKKVTVPHAVHKL
jgi:lysophosphatidic acid acyltransferase/lysophosphatidylinositol acyltransferase